ncbi:MAG: PTS sugar transporter subunit IIA [Acidipropionibacterium sp.]|nr:PTS sugar transporter subunit IIA [Acidipropionibacterium sp.]
MGDPAFDRVEDAVRASRQAQGSPSAVAVEHAHQATFGTSVLTAEGVHLGLHADSKEDAIRQAGQVLVDIGAADPAYIEGMLARENQISTYMGEGVAIPHGLNEARVHIKRAALGFLQFPDGVDWDGNTCYLAIPIASTSDEHLQIMASLARVLADPTTAAQLRSATTAQQVLDLLAPEQD